MTFIGTERWAEEESHSKGGTHTKAGWRKSPFPPHPVEKETQGVKDAPMAALQQGEPFMTQ